MTSELVICVLSSELPLDGPAQRVSSGLPGIDFTLQKLRRWHSAIQTLTTEGADLDLCHVEPTRMLGGVVEAYSAQQCAGCTLAQYIVEAFSEVDVQVVEHKMHPACGRVRVGQEFLDEADEVGLATVGGNRDDALSRLGLHRDEQIGGALADVFIVLLGRCTWCDGQWLAAEQ